MTALVYVHGFLSSPRSHKARQVHDWLRRERPDIACHCPALTPYPEEVVAALDQLMTQLLPEPVYLMGSSMGGFWVTYFAEKYNLPAVLINPAVRPFERMAEYVGVELQNYHTNDSYRLENRHIDQLRKVDTENINFKNNYWLMVQTGDETLDYRQAVEKYRGCKQLIEEGGDHGFQQFEKWIPQAVAFLEQAWSVCRADT